ncbi:MAG: SDR family NAD(P)-dependent oxidoreductase [Pseudobdellovibrionaceae bacterium]
MDLNLTGKVALVTGSSRGIGLGITNCLIDEGCEVLVNSRNKKDLLFIQKNQNRKITILPADVTKATDCKKIREQILKRYGKIDILVLNVGSGKGVRNGMETKQDWISTFDKNFYSAINVIEALQDLIKNESGSVTLVSSICAIEYIPAPLPYSVAKSSLNVYAKGLSKSLAKRGIRVNVVAPGNIIFPDSTWDNKLKNNPKEVKKYLKSEVPACRFGSPEEIGYLVSFLSSNKAAFITGSTLVIDGGQTRTFF